ncbi:TPA: hypothetical protein QDB24_002481 [Burkholderia vietnamiensis]|uniref:hypothetical protein n=1 Tax=Burkholderia TaxID=32008 RepID=UPI0008764EF9|nr:MULTISPECIES: hypothetical protein [Burkholderia]MBR7910609.1 hypothetical protein [Burkholderia vietnamiensis]MBR8081533.1 hypothetical protein [Burkholderia vietnamiensis]MBU9317055.1 hypothetical protein [Burkholderia multivorans]MDN7816203.1 hypothetical protein [Burkholderia vietnamiensis]MDN7940422.1 hypothetical protein [Burkholderia multivorans]
MQGINAAEAITSTISENTIDIKEHAIEKSNLQYALQKSKKSEDSVSQAKDDHVDSDKPLPLDEKILIPLLESELDALKKYGESVRKNRDTYHGKIQQAAIEALAKCLGLRQKYFKIDDTLLHDSMYAALYKKATTKEFKKKRKNTTEYHLISRIYRGEERRQASSDALILQRANNAGQSEPTFAAWVLSEGGLDKIRQKISAERRKNQPKKEETKPDTRKISENFLAAWKQMRAAKLVVYIKSMEKDELSKVIGKWGIPSAGESMPILVSQATDGSFVISRFDMRLDDEKPSANDYL